MAQILDGRVLARKTNRQTRLAADSLSQPPGLAVILVGEDPASRVYVGRKTRVARRLGFHHEQVDLPADVEESRLLAEVDRLNADPRISGLLVQLPLPPHIRPQVVVDRIDPRKDVDGLHPQNAGRLVLGRPALVPCTAAGILALLREHEVPIEGRIATVIGRSDIVGRPVSLLLDRAQATVTVCHSRTRDLRAHVERAELLVVAMGKPQAIPGSWIKRGATVVDAGIHRTDSGELVGDVGLEAAGERAAWITPVPGGVGPMTIAMLMANTLQAARGGPGPAEG